MLHEDEGRTIPSPASRCRRGRDRNEQDPRAAEVVRTRCDSTRHCIREQPSDGVSKVAPPPVLEGLHQSRGHPFVAHGPRAPGPSLRDRAGRQQPEVLQGEASHLPAARPTDRLAGPAATRAAAGQDKVQCCPHELPDRRTTHRRSLDVVQPSPRDAGEGVDEPTVDSSLVDHTPAATAPVSGLSSCHRPPERWKTRSPSVVRTTSLSSPVVVMLTAPGRSVIGSTWPPTCTR